MINEVVQVMENEGIREEGELLGLVRMFFEQMGIADANKVDRILEDLYHMKL